MLLIHGGFEGFPAAIEQAAREGTERHPKLRSVWNELTAPPKSDWRKEDLRRQEKARRDKQRRFRKHRRELAAHREEIASGAAFDTLYHCANAYLDRYADLPHAGSPVERLQEWLGDDLANAALEGFVRVLSRNDLPTAKQIAETHAEGKRFNAEPVLVCGIAELVRTSQSLTMRPREVLKAALAAWWDYPAPQELENMGSQLEAEIFTSDFKIADFLTTVMEPPIRAGREQVPKLYELSGDARYRQVTGRLALAWLGAYPLTALTVQKELLDTAIRLAPRDQIKALVHERIDAFGLNQVEFWPLWMTALFFVDFENSELALRAFCDEDPAHLWTLRGAVRSGDGERWLRLSVRQWEFIVERFAERWPPVALPHGGSWGVANPHDATEFIRTAIRSIGADSSREASDALDRLASSSAAAQYQRRDQAHSRAAAEAEA